MESNIWFLLTHSRDPVDIVHPTAPSLFLDCTGFRLHKLFEKCTKIQLCKLARAGKLDYVILHLCNTLVT